MVRNKVAAAMAGAALLVAAYGGVAGADGDGARDTSGDRHYGVTLLCTWFGGTGWMDTNGDGTMDTTWHFDCHGLVGTYSL